jgi:flavin-dependent dehydrogenase
VKCDFDVAVIGGGPAGCALAASLARRGRSVAVFERTHFDTRRPGETFGGELEPLLRALGAWDAFTVLPWVPFRSVCSAWGAPELAERASLTNPFGDGFHVDRARFDAMLARVTEASGAALRTGTGRCAIQRTEQGFRVQPRRGEAAAVRFLVDASGRGATATAALIPGQRWVACDRLVALVGRFSGTETSPGDLLIEAAEDGWWYSSPQPDGTRVVVFLTDSDLVPAGRRHALTTWWLAALARTRHTALPRDGPTFTGPLRIVRADSGCLVPDRAPGFCAVGDAAIALDPLAGDGVARALRSGLEAAEAVDGALSGSPLAGSSTAERFASALERRARYYQMERRWPGAPFWLRRQPPDWTTAAITLDPATQLHWDGKHAGRDLLARVEALLPPRAIAATLDLLRTPQPAHAALRLLHTLAPLGDRRLLIGLQLLVEHTKLETAVPADLLHPAHLGREES